MTSGSRPALTDAEAREAIRNDLGATLFVEAAAGTGKTTELITRIVHVLASRDRGAAIDRIVAVTFTEKAAGELKLRLRLEIERARISSPDVASRLALEEALQHLEEAHVNTIHGFCAEILQERPVEAGMDPRFEVLPEPEARDLFDQVFDRWIQDVLEDPPEGIRRALRRTPSQADEEQGPVDRLRTAAWTLAAWRDFEAPWTRPPFDRDASIDGVVRELYALAELAARGSDSDTLKRDLRKARWLYEDMRSAERVRMRDYDHLEASFVELARDRDFTGRVKKAGHREYAPGVTRDEVMARHASLVAAVLSFTRDADADLAALLRDELQAPIQRYQQAKTALGRADFVDLLLRARDLIAAHEAVRADLQQRFTHLFVDEFQDTDPLQAEILLLLASDDPSVRAWRDVTPTPGKLFVVGDPKQAIYRFRRADVAIYEDVKQLVEEKTQRPALQLSRSYRAVPAIQNFVNAAFERVFDGDRVTLQAAYVPLHPDRGPIEGQPSVVALPVPKPYSEKVPRIAKIAIEESLPDAIAAFVDWLVTESRWQIAEATDDVAPGTGDRTRKRVPVQARHVCLLFRRFESWGSDVTRPYVEALEARGVPHLLVGGKSFHQREEVETLKAALAAIERPDDELAVFATLHGSLFGLGDDVLLEYRERFASGDGPARRLKRLDPFDVPDGLPGHLKPVGRALAMLKALHVERNRVTVSDTIAALLDRTRAHAGFVLRHGGEQALANVLHVAELARRYEMAGGLSFRGFVERLLSRDGLGEPEAPVLEEASDGVRLMTAHKAKGLEFPVVILADITARLTGQQASRYIDAAHPGGLAAVRIGGWAPFDLLNHEAEELARDEKEGYRVAYVAATRARDLVVVPAVGDETLDDCWVSVLNDAMYPPMERRASPEPAPGCPAFGRDSVLNRPDNEPRQRGTVAPGAYGFTGATGAGRIPDGNRYDVVWWDPSALHLDVPADRGVRHLDLLDKDVAPEVVAASLAAHAEWADAKSDAVARGSRQTSVVMTAGERARRGGLAPPAQPVELLGPRVQATHPPGRRFGTLVHAVLAIVPLDGDESTIQALASQQGVLVGATPGEIESAAAAVASVLQHDLLARARASQARGACRRETPVMWREQGGPLVEGVVDLAFEEDAGWIVVDFKTDHDLRRGLERYRRQVALYADIIARATGRSATGVLLRV